MESTEKMAVLKHIQQKEKLVKNGIWHATCLKKVETNRKNQLEKLEKKVIVY